MSFRLFITASRHSIKIIDLSKHNLPKTIKCPLLLGARGLVSKSVPNAITNPPSRTQEDPPPLPHHLKSSYSTRRDSNRPDSNRPDSNRPDSIRPDSIRPDSIHPNSIRRGSKRRGSKRRDSIRPASRLKLNRNP